MADRGVLVEFGSTIDDAVHGQVVRLDRLLAGAGLPGVVEVTPAYANLLVSFDPVVTDHMAVEAGVRGLLALPSGEVVAERLHQIGVCYDADLGTDLAVVAAARGLTVEAVIAAHLAGAYRVYLYGFAPGYAYLAGTPPALHLPRKPAAVRDSRRPRDHRRAAMHCDDTENADGVVDHRQHAGPDIAGWPDVGR